MAIAQNPGITQMKYRYCPFCRRQITIRETVCRHCGDPLNAGELKGTDWRSMPVSKGQLKFLKQLGIRADKGLSKGVVSDMIEGAKSQRPDLFRAYDLEQAGRKEGSGFFVKFLFLVVMVAGLWVAQRFFGVFDSLKGKMKDVGTVPAEKPVVPEPEKIQPAIAPVQPAVTEQKKVPPESESLLMENRIKLQFRGVPPIGSRIRVKLKGEAVMEGVLKAIDGKGIQLEVGPALVTLERARMVLNTRIALYEEDFITYMMWRDVMIAKRREQAQRSAENLASSKISTGTSKPSATGSKPASVASTVKPSSAGEIPDKMPDDMSWKEWMDAYGEDNPILQQRLQRVKQHEESSDRTDRVSN